METTNLHITEYIGNQEIEFFGITSFKVQNHGEAVIDVNAIAIYPGQTVKIIEEDGTKCDFRLSAKFSEAGKMPKFRVIYKEVGSISPIDTLQPNYLTYTVTLLNYELGDKLEFMQNQSGYVTLRRSFQNESFKDPFLAFPDMSDIHLGFVEKNTVVRYNGGGSLDTKAIMFTNNENSENSEVFMVNGNVVPFRIYGVFILLTDSHTVNLHFDSNIYGDINGQIAVFMGYNEYLASRFEGGLFWAENVMVQYPILFINYTTGQTFTYNDPNL